MGGAPTDISKLYDDAVQAHQDALSSATRHGYGTVRVVPVVANSDWRHNTIVARCHNIDISGLILGTLWEEGWTDVVVCIRAKTGGDVVTINDPMTSFPSDNLIATIALLAVAK